MTGFWNCWSCHTFNQSWLSSGSSASPHGKSCQNSVFVRKIKHPAPTSGIPIPGCPSCAPADLQLSTTTALSLMLTEIPQGFPHCVGRPRAMGRQAAVWAHSHRTGMLEDKSKPMEKANTTNMGFSLHSLYSAIFLLQLSDISYFSAYKHICSRARIGDTWLVLPPLLPSE